MPWKQQGGGGGPWGTGPSGGPQAPDLDELLRKGQERFRRMMPGGIGTGKGILLIGLVILAIWLFSGVYRVNPGEQGVEMLFGKFVRQTDAGLHFWAPRPIGQVYTPDVAQTNVITIGFRSTTGTGRGAATRDVPEESLMLTGDQNIIDIDFVVQWNIKDASAFLFNIREPAATAKLAAESAIREVVGQTSLEDALAARREEVQRRTRTVLQNILDSYRSGIRVIDVKLQQVDPPQPVIDAFDDVQRARQDKERAQNEAEAYSNDIIPRAQGEAARIVQEATAYREQLIKQGQGEAQRFLSVYEAYKGNRDVTVKRLFLERMQQVLGGAQKIIIDSGSGGPGVVPYLPLPEIRKRSTGAGQTGAGQTGAGQSGAGQTGGGR